MGLYCSLQYISMQYLCIMYNKSVCLYCTHCIQNTIVLLVSFYPYLTCLIWPPRHLSRSPTTENVTICSSNFLHHSRISFLFSFLRSLLYWLPLSLLLHRIHQQSRRGLVLPSHFDLCMLLWKYPKVKMLRSMNLSISLYQSLLGSTLSSLVRLIGCHSLE